MHLITQMRVLLFVVALLCLPSIAIAQRNQPPTGESIISGRVVFSDTGRPVRRATVKLFTNLNYPHVRTTPANQRGEFRFTEVAAGNYFVMAESPVVVSPQSSFAITEFGINSYNSEADQTRVTVDGKNTIRCEMRVVRAGTIKGTITYVDKEPVVNARVVLFRRQGGAVTPFLITRTIRTNDRGMYRIDGIPDGEYVVGVSVGNSTGENVDPVLLKAGLPNAYYPGVTSLAEAKSIVVQSGTEATGMSFTVGDDNLRRISGVLKWRNSEQTVRGTVSIRRKGDPRSDLSLATFFRRITPDDANRDALKARDMGLVMMSLPPYADVEEGEWRFKDLAPGTYIVTGYASLPPKKASVNAKDGADPDSSDGTWVSDRWVNQHVEITLEDEDKDGVTIEFTEGGRILGSVIVADGSPPPEIPITTDFEHKAEFLQTLPYVSKADGTFLMEGVSAGEVWLDVEFVGREDLYLKSITLGGQDLMREPLRMTEGAEIAGVSITLGKGSASLSGRVQLKEDGSPAAGAGVLLVKADPKLWHLGSSRTFVNADALGTFKLKRAPGDYLVFTWPSGGQPLGSIVQFTRAQASTARTVSLQDKDEVQINLTVRATRK
ncbi:MAG TPA: carboxypeptidase-like regulatory domain-containing protein [Pyrinomonadaceae bacterium]|nr:carboxypeptidase-like regulatory domain-containing protein [Pyrinomonadaceae bacterium]